jgi:hypothetical protein
MVRAARLSSSPASDRPDSFAIDDAALALQTRFRSLSAAAVICGIDRVDTADIANTGRFRWWGLRPGATT